MIKWFLLFSAVFGLIIFGGDLKVHAAYEERAPVTCEEVDNFGYSWVNVTNAEVLDGNYATNDLGLLLIEPVIFNGFLYGTGSMFDLNFATLNPPTLTLSGSLYTFTLSDFNQPLTFEPTLDILSDSTFGVYLDLSDDGFNLTNYLHCYDFGFTFSSGSTLNSVSFDVDVFLNSGSIAVDHIRMGVDYTEQSSSSSSSSSGNTLLTLGNLNCIEYTGTGSGIICNMFDFDVYTDALVWYMDYFSMLAMKIFFFGMVCVLVLYCVNLLIKYLFSLLFNKRRR